MIFDFRSDIALVTLKQDVIWSQEVTFFIFFFLQCSSFYYSNCPSDCAYVSILYSITNKRAA